MQSQVGAGGGVKSSVFMELRVSIWAVGGKGEKKWYMVQRKQHLQGTYRFAWQQDNHLPYKS